MNSEEIEEEEGSEIYGGAIITSSSDAAGWIPKIFEGNYRTTQLVFKKKEGRTITCLRQPRDLYTLSKTNTQSTTRWPIEIPIIIERPYHILYTSPKPEPLCKKGRELEAPLRCSDVYGKVVYDNTPDPENKYFTSSKADGKVFTNQPYYTLKNAEDKTLQFESRFESGNLMRAIKVGEYEYELWLNFDLYTKKHTQWYYFQLKNTRPNVTYKFTIMNFLKSGSLYNEGMKPLLYSLKDAEEKKVGWVRDGSNIKYYRNDIKVEENKERCYYSLHFTLQFPNVNDTYYLAHSYPYTYSDLQEYLSYLAFDPHRKKCCKQRVLCQTLAGNHIYVLTITAPTRCPKQAKLKKAIVISARVHPGETVSSWMMKGLLDYLTSDENDAKILRETFVFKIIPMLNPDGVIVGNYRCSLSGRDLNRNYKTLLKDSFPPVWHVKHMIKKVQEERSVVLYCDFHGHSRKKNIFIYGCENKLDKRKGLHAKVFPLMLSKNTQDKFSFGGCRFRIQKSKEGTGRVVIWNQGIKYSYTLEASFCGSSQAENKEDHFGVQDYEAMGYHFCDTLLDLFDPDPTKFNTLLAELQHKLHSAAMKRLFDNNNSINEDNSLLDDLSELETDSFGSDSSVSDGLPMQLIYGTSKDISKKKRLRTRKERNKRRKKQPSKHKNSASLEKMSGSYNILSRETSPLKSSKKQESYSQNMNSKISYSKKKSKEKGVTMESFTPTRITSTNDYLDSLTYSYVQAGLIDASLKENNTSPPCEKCNPSYYLSYETSNSDVACARNHRQPNYSLFEVRMPSECIESNPTLDLARKITAYNYRTGKVAPRMSRMFAIWSKENKKREELLKRQTVDQGDNAEYLRKLLASISKKDDLATQSDFPLNRSNSDVYKPLPPRTATSVDFSLCKPHTNNFSMTSSQARNIINPTMNKNVALPKLRNQVNKSAKIKLPIHNVGNNNLEIALPTKSLDIGIEHKQKFSPPASPKYSALLRQKFQLKSPTLRNVENPKNKEDKLKERLLSFGGSGILFNPINPITDRKAKKSPPASVLTLPTPSLTLESLTPSIASYHSPVNEKSSSPSYCKSKETSPILRVLTPQQYCIFSELEDNT